MSRIATFYDHILEIAAQENCSVIEALQEAKCLGVCAVEVAEDKLLGHEEQLEREMAASGIRISTVPSYFDFGRNFDVPAQSLQTLESAKRLGVEKILVIPGFCDAGASAEERERATRSTIDCINELAELAQGYGVSLLMEDFDSMEAVFSKTEEVRRFVENCPGLACCFDTGNFRFQAESELAAYDQLRPYVQYVHLKDRATTPRYGSTERVAADGVKLYPAPIGAGEIHIAELIERFEESGYTGLYSVEHYDVTEMLPSLKRSIQWVQSKISS